MQFEVEVDNQILELLKLDVVPSPEFDVQFEQLSGELEVVPIQISLTP